MVFKKYISKRHTAYLSLPYDAILEVSLNPRSNTFLISLFVERTTQQTLSPEK